jgi:hypothetical protein
LAVAFRELADLAKNQQRELIIASSVTSLFILWNLGFIFQWGTHLVPARGPISWKQMVHNQFTRVPVQVLTDLKAYAVNRAGLMREIEREDVEQLKKHQGVMGAE